MEKINKYDVLIVGAGLTGITAGKYLRQNGFTVKILDKGKAIGGRLATRRIEIDNQKYQIDYGCKYLEANSFEFIQELLELVKSDTIKQWKTSHNTALFDELEKNIKFVGRQSMRQIAFELSKGLDISNNVKVNNLNYRNDSWVVTDEQNNSISANSIILTMPVPQILELLSNSEIGLERETMVQLEEVKYERSIAGLFILNGESKLKSEGGLLFENNPISFITDNNLKGVNTGLTALTVEMSNNFSIENWEKPDDEIINKIIDTASEYLSSEIVKSQIHKWKYSTPLKSYPNKYEAIEIPGPLYIAGDAFGGDNVESAYLSGLYSAKSIHKKYSKEISEIEV